MKEKPILFSTPMVQAILAGRKTQTRRPFRFKMLGGRNPEFSGYSLGESFTGHIESGAVLYQRQGDFAVWGEVSNRVFPKYKVGDVLWVRETFYAYGTWNDNLDVFETKTGKPKKTFIAYPNQKIYYADTWGNMPYKRGKSNDVGYYKRPSIFMPKDACRLRLRVTKVRAERLQDITPSDSVAEGMESIYEFKSLWNVLNEKRGYAWRDNPYVFVYNFEREGV